MNYKNGVKNKVALLIFSLMISCSAETKVEERVEKTVSKIVDSVVESEKIIDLPKKQVLQKTKIDRHTYWYLSEYIDSTISNKSIFKYSQDNASFAYLLMLNEQKDSIEMYGYHESHIQDLVKVSENMFLLGEGAQYFTVEIKSAILYLQEFKNEKPQKLYKYHLKDKKIYEPSLYFAQNIFANTYIDLNGNEFTFNEDLSITGIDSLSSYFLEVDFWEMIPSMDMLSFRTKDNKVVSFNWQYRSDSLVLRNFTPSKELDFGGWTDLIIHEKPVHVWVKK